MTATYEDIFGREAADFRDKGERAKEHERQVIEQREAELKACYMRIVVAYGLAYKAAAAVQEARMIAISKKPDPSCWSLGREFFGELSRYLQDRDTNRLAIAELAAHGVKLEIKPTNATVNGRRIYDCFFSLL